jgi:predicted nucleic acid-binding protein
MVLVDTSVWIDHLVKSDFRLMMLLEDNSVLVHQYIVGELACGNIKNRDEILMLLNSLKKITTVSHDEVLFFIDNHKLFGKGLAYKDIHIIASCLIEDVLLYTHDTQLARAAKHFDRVWE